MPTYTCVKCNTEKPLTEFNKKKGDRTGHSYTCRECTNAKNRALTPRKSPKVDDAKAARIRNYVVKRETKPDGTVRVMFGDKHPPKTGDKPRGMKSPGAQSGMPLFDKY